MTDQPTTPEARPEPSWLRQLRADMLMEVGATPVASGVKVIADRATALAAAYLRPLHDELFSQGVARDLREQAREVSLDGADAGDRVTLTGTVTAGRSPGAFRVVLDCDAADVIIAHEFTTPRGISVTRSVPLPTKPGAIIRCEISTFSDRPLVAESATGFSGQFGWKVPGVSRFWPPESITRLIEVIRDGGDPS